MENQKITKRNGQTAAFDIEKITKTVERATDGFQLDKNKLLETIPSFFKNEMPASEINKALILSALNLTSVIEPDWKNVAGRLKVFDLYKDVKNYRQSGSAVPYAYENFLEYAVKNNVYSSVITEKYSKEEIKEAASFINPAYDLVYDYAGANLLIKRYLCEHNDHIVELPQEMFLTIALLIEQNEDKANRMQQVKDTYQKLADRKISLPPERQPQLLLYSRYGR